MTEINVAIVGACGYGGCGSVEILAFHPYAKIVALVDQEGVGKPYSSIYPHLKGFCDMVILPPEFDSIKERVDVVFFATPDGVGQTYAAYWIKKGARVIDFSGDFRFQALDQYKEYAKRIGKPEVHSAPELLKDAVYGLAELHREEIMKAKVVGNPGCFAVSCILGLAPALASNLIHLDRIILDAKTGVSGAGKRPNPTFHYPHRYDNMNAYRIAMHQHVLEIERECSLFARQEIRVTFTPHVIPLTRGILSTIYGSLKDRPGAEEVVALYKEFYKGCAFVRIAGPEEAQQSSYVRGTNFCNLWLNVDQRTNTLIVVSHIDNLMKGQAGNAVQNMNVMFGLSESTGLMRPSQYP